MLLFSSVNLLFTGHILTLKLPLHDGIRLYDLRVLFNLRIYDWFGKWESFLGSLETEPLETLLEYTLVFLSHIFSVAKL